VQYILLTTYKLQSKLYRIAAHTVLHIYIPVPMTTYCHRSQSLAIISMTVQWSARLHNQHVHFIAHLATTIWFENTSTVTNNMLKMLKVIKVSIVLWDRNDTQPSSGDLWDEMKKQCMVALLHHPLMPPAPPPPCLHTLKPLGSKGSSWMSSRRDTWFMFNFVSPGGAQVGHSRCGSTCSKIKVLWGVHSS
jgi:hypothetical protein